MRFTNRTEAGRLLARALGGYKSEDTVVFAIPRGGVSVAVEVAKYLCAPLDVIIARKIANPQYPEYAIAAVAENGHMITEQNVFGETDQAWLIQQIAKQRKEAARRRSLYTPGRKKYSLRDTTAVLVDDGVATGLTMRVGIIELKHLNPKKIIVGVPIAPQSTIPILSAEVDTVIALEIASDQTFLGSVGAYYDNFEQISDQEVVKILDQHSAWLKNQKSALAHKSN